MSEKQPPSEEKTQAQPTQQAPQTEGVIEQREKELSPETMEKIMEKVQDIGESSIAYTRIGTLGNRRERAVSDELMKIKEIAEMPIRKFREREENLIDIYALPQILQRDLERINTILKKGLVGTYKDSSLRSNPEEYGGNEYRKELKESKRSLVHFNITGRAWDYWNPKTYNDIPTELQEILEIGNGYWARNPATVMLIFDISNLTETYPGVEQFDLGENKKVSYVYAAANRADVLYPFSSRDYQSLEGRDAKDIFRLPGEKDEKISGTRYHKILVTPSTEYGFITSPRVPPRRFRGFVLSPIKEKFTSSVIDFKESRFEFYSDAELSALATRLAESARSLYEKGEGVLLPIYSTKGNLLWPKKMSYEEVKKFVAEREEKREGKDS